MPQTRSVSLATALLAISVVHGVVSPRPAVAEPRPRPATFDEARVHAAERDTPVLLEFYTEW